MFDLIKNAILAACETMVTNEEHLNQLDTGCGDGDCGSTLRRGAQGMLGGGQV